MVDVFSQILSIEAPNRVECTGNPPANGEFSIRFRANGSIPFAQVVLWTEQGQRLVRASSLPEDITAYLAVVPAGFVPLGRVHVQAEGCRRPDIESARGEDWIKAYADIDVVAAARPIQGTTPEGVRLYFGIHKHMHQPYYHAADTEYWDGTIDGIFSQRRGPYVDYLVDAMERYVAGGLPYAGLSVSFSGSLLEQLDRCANTGRCGGAFTGWSQRLRQALATRTVQGHPRIGFSAFGFFHPLMPLIPSRDLVRQVRQHRQLVEQVFGSPASSILFPPETAFHVRMIPALLESEITAVIYDSIHRFRACRDYPYAGPTEGMLPPNRAEQMNPAVSDWLQLRNIWAGSQISPSLLRPSLIGYTDPDGREYQIVGVPAERYIGNEDARGGFGALQYPHVLGQLFDRIVQTGSFDPKHPPFFILHSDGDNFGGGADSYYRNNTERLVEWLREDTRFELTTIGDYLQRFPVDAGEVVHLEPGAWSGADNGDPSFSKWFGLAQEQYSPDLNSWAVLTALQNAVHSLADTWAACPVLESVERLLLTAETSCYWYWTGQDIWDAQVTLAVNQAWSLLLPHWDEISRRDQTGPTIFPPWIVPANPGGKQWGNGRLVDAPREATLHTLIDDLVEVKRAEVVLRYGGEERRLPLVDAGPYPSRTGARRSAHHYRLELPVGLGDVRYFIRAVDTADNVAQSALERVWLV